MRIFGKVDGRINRHDRAAWLTPIFDLDVGPRPPVPPPAEFFYGPAVPGAPWRPKEEEPKLVVAPPPPPPDTTPPPEVAAGPPIPEAPWFRVPFLPLPGGPGPGTIVPGQQRVRWQNPRVNRVMGKAGQAGGLSGGAAQSPDERRLRRHSEVVQEIMNSLLDQGYIRFVGQNPLRFQIINGALTGAGPPTSDTDKSEGAIVGCVYVDTAARRFYVCVDNTLSAAVWRGPY